MGEVSTTRWLPATIAAARSRKARLTHDVRVIADHDRTPTGLQEARQLTKRVGHVNVDHVCLDPLQPSRERGRDGYGEHTAQLRNTDLDAGGDSAERGPRTSRRDEHV
jgi:hypothetical protein